MTIERRTHSRSTRLAGGGAVVVIVEGDPFAMSNTDRHLVFELLDRVTEHAATHGAGTAPAVDVETIGFLSAPMTVPASDMEGGAPPARMPERPSPRKRSPLAGRPRPPYKCSRCDGAGHTARSKDCPGSPPVLDPARHEVASPPSEESPAADCGAAANLAHVNAAYRISREGQPPWPDSEPPPRLPALDPWHDPDARAAREVELAAAAKRAADEKLSKGARRARQRLADQRAARERASTPRPPNGAR